MKRLLTRPLLSQDENPYDRYYYSKKHNHNLIQSKLWFLRIVRAYSDQLYSSTLKSSNNPLQRETKPGISKKKTLFFAKMTSPAEMKMLYPCSAKRPLWKNQRSQSQIYLLYSRGLPVLRNSKTDCLDKLIFQIETSSLTQGDRVLAQSISNPALSQKIRWKREITVAAHSCHQTVFLRKNLLYNMEVSSVQCRILGQEIRWRYERD